MIFGFWRSGVMPLRGSPSIFSDFGFNFRAIFCIGNFDFTGRSDKSKVFRLGWFPLPAVCTTAALANPEWLHCITKGLGTVTNFERFQVFFLQASLVVHISPGTAFVIHIDDSSLHFGKRRIIADNLFRFNAPQHLVVANHEPFFLVAVVLMLGSHISRNGHGASSFDSLKTEIKGGFIAPVDSGNHPEAFGCPVSSAPAVAEYVVTLHDRLHFQVHTEIRGQNRTVPGQFFDVVVGILPDPFKAIVVSEELHHAVKMILVFQMGLVKSSQQKIVKVSWFFLELWYDGNFQLSFAREPVAT